MEYLLFLQNIRLQLGSGVESVVTAYSDDMLYVAFLLPFILFWLNKELGTFVLVNYEAGKALNGLLKVTACIQRPWILDARIQPSDAARVHATGYSFPSGHTTTATATLSSIAIKSRHAWIQALCWILIALVMLSRNYLGVHTPQDVLVGFGATLAVVLLASPVRQWIRDRRIHDWQLVLVTAIICVAGIAYTILKPYPVSELVDPLAMQRDTIRELSELLGCAIGLYVESHYIRLSTENLSTRTRIVRVVLGVLVLLAANIGFGKVCNAISLQYGKGLTHFLLVLTGTVVIPYLFTRIDRHM